MQQHTVCLCAPSACRPSHCLSLDVIPERWSIFDIIFHSSDQFQNHSQWPDSRHSHTAATPEQEWLGKAFPDKSEKLILVFDPRGPSNKLQALQSELLQVRSPEVLAWKLLLFFFCDPDCLGLEKSDSPEEQHSNGPDAGLRSRSHLVCQLAGWWGGENVPPIQAIFSQDCTTPSKSGRANWNFDNRRKMQSLGSSATLHPIIKIMKGKPALVVPSVLNERELPGGCGPLIEWRYHSCQLAMVHLLITFGLMFPWDGGPLARDPPDCSKASVASSTFRLRVS